MTRRLAVLFVLCVVMGLVYVPSAGAGGGGCSERLTGGSGRRVAARNFCFSPTVLYIERGDRVRWTNRDDVRHVIASAGLRWVRFLKKNGGTFGHTFNRKGVYPYSCYLHPGMNGAVVVGKVKAPVAGSAAESLSAPLGQPAAGPRGDQLPVVVLIGLLAASTVLALVRVTRRKRSRAHSGAVIFR
jgi:plastocyanin